MALSKYIPELAKNVIKIYTENNKSNYLDNYFRFQIAAGEYEGSIKTLNDLRELDYISDPEIGKAIGLQFQIYAESKIIFQKENIPFDSAFRRRLNSTLQNITDKTADRFVTYFVTSLTSLKQNFNKLILQLDTNSDSLSLSKSMQLCRTYNSYLVYTYIIPNGKPLIDKFISQQYIINDSTIIYTSDSAEISALIVSKKRFQSKMPVILTYNIYTGDDDLLYAKRAAQNGFIGISINPRGKKTSKGVFEPYIFDSKDIYDVIDWISKQSWSNGKVGMYGGSYLGYSLWAACKKIHPALKTIVPVASVCPSVTIPSINGVIKSNELAWIHFVTNSKMTDYKEYSSNYWDNIFNRWYVTGIPFSKLDSLDGRPNKLFQKLIKTPSYDSYWKNLIPNIKEFSRINIPILSISGYYDGELKGTLHYFNEHNKYNRNNQHYILLGPYTHQGVQDVPSPIISKFKVDSVANISITNLVFEWFDFILNDKQKPSILKDKFNYQVSGENKWHHNNSISEINNDSLKFFLDGNLIDGDKYLSKTMPDLKKFVVQKIDLSYRVDTLIKGSSYLDTNINRRNRIIYISDTLKENITFNGSIIGNLTVEINKKDFDFNVNIYELLPNGKFLQLNNSSIFRASFCNNKEKRILLKPNKKQSIKFNNNIFSSRLLLKGSRIVVSFGINKSPQYQINYGTGKDVSLESIKDAGAPLQIKWYNDSYIKIPVWRDK